MPPRVRVSETELAAADPGQQSILLQQFAPAQLAAAKAFSMAVYQNTKLPFRVVEGARHRTAQINGCQTCQTFRSEHDLAPLLRDSDRANFFNSGAPPDEAFYEAVENWRSSSVFSEQERLAIEFAERMGLEPRSFRDDEKFWTRMHATFTDEEIVNLTLAVASWIGMGRVLHVLELDPPMCAIPA